MTDIYRSRQLVFQLNINSRNRMVNLRLVSDIIKLLPDHVANQIAAGEVIQRPASAVKELLENAIDAGSTAITLTIKDGGKTFIQVMDNGKGMSPMDARLCWERHATSKISVTEDIYAVRTMGFRGEALASIASVAQVELKTKRAIDQVGTRIVIEASAVVTQETTAAGEGTVITVKNLFYNIPARRNFLKSNPVETRHIIDEFLRLALAYPQINLAMINNDNETFSFKAGSMQHRIEQVFGYRLGNQLLFTEEATSIATIRGYFGKPDIAKKTRGEQYLFVNNRFIKDAYLNHAVVSCYEQLITKEHFPFYVLHIEINPSHIDVNVHPTKTEIKFDDERSVYQIVKAVARKAIGEHFFVPTYEPMGEDHFLQLRQQGLTSTNTPNTATHATNHLSNTVGQSTSFTKPAGKQDWQELYAVLNKSTDTVGKSLYKQQETPNLLPETNIPAFGKYIQIHGCFILAIIKSGVLLIDQQAAHQRILYEKYIDQLSKNDVSTQQKLFPKSIQLSATDTILLQSLLPSLKTLGFDIDALGPQTFAINGVPAEFTQTNEAELLIQMLAEYQQDIGNGNNDKLARALAQKAAIGYGKSLSDAEISQLIDNLFACAEPNIAPNGKPCLTTLSIDQLFGLLK